MAKKRKSKKVAMNKARQAVKGMGTPATLGDKMAAKLGKMFGW